MNNLYITGAAGWLGKNLIKYIINNSKSLGLEAFDAKNIHALCLESDDASDIQQFGVNIHRGDVRNIESLKSFFTNANNSVVIHLAGIIHPKLKTSDFFDINYLGTRNVVEICQRNGVKKIVIMSSNSPIGCNKSNRDYDIFTEESEFNPYMKYGKSKYVMEKWLWNFISKNQSPKISIIRAPWFYGPNQPARQSLFFTMIKEGKFPIVGSGENKRSMAYTENLSQGIMLAATSDRADGKAYWIADEKPYTMNEIVLTIKNVLETEFNIKCSKKTIRLPSVVSDVAFLADKTLQGVGLYHQKIHVLSEMNKSIFCSIERAKQDLGYHPKYDLYKGMKESIKWCLDNGIKI